MKRTTITIPDELSRIIEDEARRTNTNVSAVVRMALEQTFRSAGGRVVGFAAICDSPNLPAGRAIDAALEVIRPSQQKGSPLDVAGIELDVTTDEIVEAVKESRRSRR